MVKKLKYFLFLLPFLTILNVDAVSLPQPNVYIREDTGSISSSSASTGTWWDMSVWSGPYIGFFTSAAPRITQVDYNFIGTNYCSNKDLSISGKIGALYDLFTEQSYTITILNNAEPLTCSYSLDNSSRLSFTCYGHGGGNFIIYIKQNSFNGNKNYHTAVIKDVSISCDVSNQQIVNQSIINSQNIINNQNQNTNKIIESQEEIKDSITSESQPNTNQNINDMNSMVASDTPISDLITMPLTLINAYINGINTSCSPVNLGNLYGTDLILPCINLEQRLGSNLWNIIDTFFCIFMCYNIGMLFITAFDGITSLRDDFEGLYQPRHADTGYQPKHGGGN